MNIHHELKNIIDSQAQTILNDLLSLYYEGIALHKPFFEAVYERIAKKLSMFESDIMISLIEHIPDELCIGNNESIFLPISQSSHTIDCLREERLHELKHVSKSLDKKLLMVMQKNPYPFDIFEWFECNLPKELSNSDKKLIFTNLLSSVQEELDSDTLVQCLLYYKNENRKV